MQVRIFVFLLLYLPLVTMGQALEDVVKEVTQVLEKEKVPLPKLGYCPDCERPDNLPEKMIVCMYDLCGQPGEVVLEKDYTKSVIERVQKEQGEGRLKSPLVDKALVESLQKRWDFLNGIKESIGKYLNEKYFEKNKPGHDEKYFLSRLRLDTLKDNKDAYQVYLDKFDKKISMQMQNIKKEYEALPKKEAREYLRQKIEALIARMKADPTSFNGKSYHQNLLLDIQNDFKNKLDLADDQMESFYEKYLLAEEMFSTHEGYCQKGECLVPLNKALSDLLLHPYYDSGDEKFLDFKNEIMEECESSLNVAHHAIPDKEVNDKILARWPDIHKGYFQKLNGKFSEVTLLLLEIHMKNKIKLSFQEKNYEGEILNRLQRVDKNMKESDDELGSNPSPGQLLEKYRFSLRQMGEPGIFDNYRPVCDPPALGDGDRLNHSTGTLDLLNIYLSPATVENFDSYGQGILGHEFGHAFSKFMRLYPKRSEESFASMEKIRQCVSSLYEGPERPLNEKKSSIVYHNDKRTTEEDFADLLTGYLYEDNKVNFACSYANMYSDDGTYDYGILDEGRGSVHSAKFFRMLHIYTVQNKELPSSCNIALGAQPTLKYDLKSCVDAGKSTEPSAPQ